jgi:NAD(P)-dependent dehydrogenase (short-subunit alcohol dehydrogenase family)
MKGNESMLNKPFSNKTAIVTGASSGIERALALALAKAGAAVVIHARRKDWLVVVFNRTIMGEEK